jgi:very-short-patch-repair endonuclease
MGVYSNNHHNKNLNNLARAQRKNMPPGERKLWYEALCTKKMMNYSFVRQRSIGNYIADFFCKELRLIIEVDGKTHDWRVEEDTERDRVLSNLGYFILRIRHIDVMNDFDAVLRIIECKITEIESGNVQVRQ